MFPKCILYATPEKNKRDNKTLTKLVKDRLARWRRGGDQYMSLWQEAVKSMRVSPETKRRAADNQPS